MYIWRGITFAVYFMYKSRTFKAEPVSTLEKPGTCKTKIHDKIGSRLEEQEYAITPSDSQMKKSVREVIKARAYATYEGQQPASDSITWHMLAAKGLPFKGTTTRNQQVAIHRLCFGYKCHWEIGVPKELDCPECNSSTSKPLLHYILECCHSHQFFGLRMDVEVEGALAEAAKQVNTALNDRVSIIALPREHPVPR